MEEDIEIIQNIIYNENGDQMNYIDIDNGTPDNECETFITAIEHLIKGYKKLKEENKTLKNFTSYIFNEDVAEFIPISLVKEKIEELKEKEQELSDEKGYWGGSDLLAKIEVLQELLER